MTGPGDGQTATAYDAALRLLARREHSRRELKSKLLQRAYALDIIEQALDRLSEQDYLSDRRFAGLYAAERVGKGFGARRIEAELRERGIDAAEIAAALGPFADRWEAVLADLCAHRFGAEPPADRREWQRRARFLEGRGFATASIRRVLGDYG